MSNLSNYFPTGILVLETGEIFPGVAIGATQNENTGTLCFNTAMTGYQEAITDPSYAGQLLIFSFPHIGNVGVNEEDQESDYPLVQGIILGHIPTQFSNHRSQCSLEAYLLQKGILGLAQVDTRTLITHIREAKNPIKAIIHRITLNESNSKISDLALASLTEKALATPGLAELPLRMVSCKQIYEWQEVLPLFSPLSAQLKKSPFAYKVIVMDFGVKNSILRVLKTLGFRVWVVPYDTRDSDILALNPDAVVLSNGPGDPRSMPDSVLDNINVLMSHSLPILGICLGYQLLAILQGAEIIKLPCGHHGNNHPVQVLDKKDILITSQNHEFAVNESTVPDCLIPTHRSLFDGSLEGFKVRDKPILAVQFHPEASPGPTDAVVIFHEFLTIIDSHQKQKTNVCSLAYA